VCLAIPGCVDQRFEANGLPMARVDFNGVRRDVCLAYVPDAREGDYVVVHVWFAISIIDAAEAARSLALLDEAATRAELLPDEPDKEERS
jgi:hydrogenase expression/formation protein HypC